MQNLFQDCQLKVLKCLTHTEIKDLYESSPENEIMLDSLIAYTGITIQCTSIVTDSDIIWFTMMGFRLILLRTHTIDASNNQTWCENGKFHRDDDLPAFITPNGTQFWFQHGVFHRGNNRPAIIWPNGDMEWYNNGIEYDGN